MKNFLIIFLITVSTLNAQNKYLTRTGTINFEASVPSFEEVAAKNNSVTAIINIETGEIAALALVKAFRFKNALMEEHFNENYAESDEYPKATFKGNIVNFNPNQILAETTTIRVKGNLEFHGVTKSFDNIKLSIAKSETGYNLKGEFNLNADDFNIKIPSIVKNKVSKEVQVLVDFNLEKQ